MKIFIKIFSICVIILCFVSINTQNIFTDNQVSKAFLVEKYLLLHKEKITDYATKYKFIDDESIQNNLSKIDTLIISLKRIQNNNSGNEDLAISLILGDIKKLNNEMELLLSARKLKYDKTLQTQKNVYQDLGKKLSIKLDQVYFMIFPILSQKSELNDKEAKTKDSLEILNILSEELKNFGYKDFDTMEEMQTFFLGILSKVKHYVLVMKENMK